MSFDLSNYVDVPTRIRQLREKHPHAVLRPYNPAEPFRIVEIGGREFIIYTAVCYRTPDDPMPAIAVAAEPVIGSSSFTRNSEVMNAETSAWGRCIMAALAVDEPHIASREEVQNRRNDDTAKLTEQIVRDVFPESQTVEPHPAAHQPSGSQKLAAVASVKQQNLIKKLSRERQIADLHAHASDVLNRQVDSLTTLSTKEASKVIESLMNGG
ncbi:MAG: hypothetical protein EBS84_21485 [Proteobacteria bacterium]|nr:hypothetical protein [Verrucomicrobiota bacterium]NBU11543.1 hypothetical protein [Pseudomonadota bacterium]NDE96846.1 hypothetical protein [Verrucomicrobiota bacterium]